MRTSFLTLTICLIAIPAYAKYSGGRGVPDDPYQIATAENLMLLGETPEDYDKHFILTADIDLDPNLPGRKVFDKAVIAPDTSDLEPDFQGTPFTGVFDGNGHTIKNLKVTGAEYLGLFGSLGFTASVSNLGVQAVEVNGTGRAVGGLAGYNDGSIVNSYSSGSVRGTSRVGGLVGFNIGKISNGNSSGSVSGAEPGVGGLVGHNWFTGSIDSSYSSASVSGNSSVGGLVGGNRASGSIDSSYSSGSVSGTDSVGGLVGANNGIATQCYSSGSVSGTDYVGGLVGYNGWRIVNSYSSGSVSGTDHVGGLVGYYGRSIAASFWDIQTSGQATSAGGTGKTTAEMQTAGTFLEAGWDFVDETDNGTEDIWKIAEGLGYPRLSWERYSGGTGEPNDPYQIATVADLIALGETPEDYDKHFVLTADIDLDPNLPGGRVFDKAVISPSGYGAFTGVFNGKGRSVSHLTIVGEHNLGLFGWLGDRGEVRNLGVVDVDVAGSGNCIGGLVGCNWGTVSRCYSTGAVNGGSSVGGLLGYNGTATDCFSTASVSGDSYIGGLVGWNSDGGTVTNCYSTGAVSGNYEVGGLVGSGLYWPDTFPPRPPRHTGIVTGSFWDVQTSGQGTSNGGIGKVTAQMQDIQMYVEAGWDFVGRIENGTRETWQMPEGGGYPVLAVFHGYAPVALLGQGTPEDPYLISNAWELGAMFYYNPAAHYRLKSSIDLEGIRWHTAVVPCFAGTFDGDGFTISHLTIAGGNPQDYYLGLVSRLESAAIVKDLGVVDINITGPGGALAGANNGATVIRCYSTGRISGYGSGGLVRENWGGTVIDCHSTCEVGNGLGNSGGLIGRNYGHITNCYSAGATSGDNDVGGLVGDNRGSIDQCYSTGAVSGRSSVGGLVGHNWGRVTLCYSTGTVSGGGGVGGLVGGNDGQIANCYSTGAVSRFSGSGAVGGLVGGNRGSATQCYSTGAVEGGGLIGGLVGAHKDPWAGQAVATACLWDTQTSGQAQSDGGTGKTTAEMKDIQTYLNAGWDFVGETGNGTSDVWQIPEGGGYPVLTVFNGYVPPQLQGAGTIENPYVISSAQELGAAIHYSPSAHYRLTASIDLGGIRWGTAVIPWFTGVFDGNGHTVSHLTINGGSYLGLFGQLAAGAEVRNLEVVGVDVTGAGMFVGGLIGSNGGTVTECASAGVVRGGSHVAGLVGENLGVTVRCHSTAAVDAAGWYVGGLAGDSGSRSEDSPAELIQCYSTGEVTAGGWSVGGLVGIAWGNSRVHDCYSAGAVSGYRYVGGLAGRNDQGSVAMSYSTGAVDGTSHAGGLLGESQGGTVAQCYSIGRVSGMGETVGGLVGVLRGDAVVTQSLWDIQSSGQTTSNAGTGKTTAEMQTASTFLDAGWDFVGETANGTEDIWWILEGQDYPRLWWEAAEQ